MRGGSESCRWCGFSRALRLARVGVSPVVIALLAELALLGCGARGMREHDLGESETGSPLGSGRLDPGASAADRDLFARDAGFVPWVPELAAEPSAWGALGVLIDRVAITPDGRLGYLSRGNGPEVVVFDCEAGRTVAVFSIDGASAVAGAAGRPVFAESVAADIHLAPDGKRVWVLDSRNERIVEIDGDTGRVLGSVRTGGYPLALGRPSSAPAGIAAPESLPGAWWPSAPFGSDRPARAISDSRELTPVNPERRRLGAG